VFHHYNLATTFWPSCASHRKILPPSVPAVRHSLATLLVLLLLASCVRAPSRLTRAQPRDVLYSELVGQWRGSIELRRADRAVSQVLPSDLTVLPAPDRDGLELRYRYGTGTGTMVHSSSHWHFGQALDAAQWGGVLDQQLQHYAVVERSGGRDGQPLRLVLEGHGVDGNRPARIRQTLEVRTGSLQLRKDVQVDGEAFSFRHALTFRRAE
jgi:hypothetical protein